MKQAILFLICFATLLRANLFFTDRMIESHLQTYSDQEIALIENDLCAVRSICLDGIENADSRFYLATAGAPGARKTTILERFVSSHAEYQKGVYLDPDPRTLRFMVHTYYAQSLTPLVIAQTGSYDQVIRNAYAKWRPASNYIALSLLEEAFAAGRSVIHGTTCTGDHIPDFFAKLKENNYKIVLLLCSCQDSLRREAIEYRNQIVRFYQSSPEEALSKGKLFPQRLGAFFNYADLIYLYWSDDLQNPERLAGIWQNGKLEILDQDALDRFIQKYETDRLALQAEGQNLPPFETYLNNASS